MLYAMSNLTQITREVSDKQVNRAFILINIIVCFFLFVLPLIIAPQPFSTWGYIRMISVIIHILLVFYINYFLFIDLFLKKRRLGLFLFANLCLCCLFTGISILIAKEAPLPPDFYEDYPLIVHFIRNFVSVTMFTILAVAIRMTIEWYKTEREKAKIEAVASQAELQNLKSQLNPHFLFNTMNNIYSLIAIDKEKAQNAVIGLSRILRYVLYDNFQDKVSLDKDLSFTRNYVELMSLRLNDKTTLNVNIPGQVQDMDIAPLLFITLIENAFKHGVSRSDASFIDIDIKIDGSTVECVVKNSFSPKRENDYSGSGIGIANLQRRLALLYPTKHKYDTSLVDNVYTATLIIQLT